MIMKLNNHIEQLAWPTMSTKVALDHATHAKRKFANGVDMNNLKIIIGALLLLIIIVVQIVQKRKQSNTSSSNPISEAEVYLAYGRKKEAKAILEYYLLSNPGDQKAIELLKQTK